jgi:hypothetical protein
VRDQQWNAILWEMINKQTKRYTEPTFDLKLASTQKYHAIGWLRMLYIKLDFNRIYGDYVIFSLTLTFEFNREMKIG